MTEEDIKAALREALRIANARQRMTPDVLMFAEDVGEMIEAKEAKSDG